MCGIAAIFAHSNNAPPIDPDELLRIREVMIARGPDGSGLWISPDGRVGLAHRRLSIIDLSDAGSQPMVSSDGMFRIVFNGEIYNYKELRSELEKKGFRFHSQSDTEVLLHLYADRGLEMMHALRGMYAFAIWDEAKRGLFLARDPFGIKPLYYADDGYTIKIASQVKALLKGNRINTALEPAGHVGFFLWGYVPEPFTLYKGIRTLPAGSILWLDEAGRYKLIKFCSITDLFARATESVPAISLKERQERLRYALLDSVSQHLVADVPVGIFLSAGLDSTTLTALASEISPDSLRTITLGFREYQGTGNDETLWSEKVAECYGTRHQTRWISKNDFRSYYHHLLEVMDQPTTDGINTYFVSKVAAQTGLKVTLSGLGGDELFGGYPSFKQIPRTVNVLGPLQSIAVLGKALRRVSVPFLKYFTSPKYAGLLEYGNNYSGAYLLRRGLFMPWELPDILDGDMVREGWEELQPLLRLEETIRGIGTDYLKISVLEMTWYMRNQLLRDADWAGMAHSLEIRVPLVDIELFRSILPFLAMDQPPTKLDMACTPINPLPDEVLSRGKTGFTVPVRDWLMSEGSTRYAGRGLRGWAHLIYDLIYDSNRFSG